MPALTPNSGREFPKTAVSDGDFILFTPGNPGYVVIEGSGGSGTLPTSDAADGVIGSNIPVDAMLVAGENPSGKTEPLQVDANNELITSSIGVTLNSTGQAALTTSTIIIAANTSRAAVVIANTDKTHAVYIGVTGVTNSTGHWVGPSTAVSMPVRSAIYGCSDDGSSVKVTFLEIV
jgi:hypothetical protein